MADRYRDYDVLDKWDTLSWNDKTRQVVRERMARSDRSETLTARQLETLRRLIARIAPQPDGRAPANTLATVVHKIDADHGDGYRHAALPRLQECWQRGLDAIEAEAQARHGQSFDALADADADALLSAIENGQTRAAAWDTLPAETFWNWRLLPDVVSAHWSHPSLWSHMGFGGPASPRGYVRLSTNMRDGWEAKEHGDG